MTGEDAKGPPKEDLLLAHGPKLQRFGLSTMRVWPVMQLASLEARKRAA